MKHFNIFFSIILFSVFLIVTANAQTNARTHKTTDHVKQYKPVKKVYKHKKNKHYPVSGNVVKNARKDAAKTFLIATSLDTAASRPRVLCDTVQSLSHSCNNRFLQITSTILRDTTFVMTTRVTYNTVVEKKLLRRKRRNITPKYVNCAEWIIEEYEPRNMKIVEPLWCELKPFPETSTVAKIPIVTMPDLKTSIYYLKSIHMSVGDVTSALVATDFDTCGCGHMKDKFTSVEPLMRIAMLDPFKFKCALWKAYLISGVTPEAQLKVFIAESRLYAEAQSSSNMLFYNGAGREVFKDAGLNRDSAWRNLNPYKIVLTLAEIDKVRLRFNKRLKSKIDKGLDIEFLDYGPFNMAPSVCRGDMNHVIFKRGSVGYENNKELDMRGNNDGCITEGEMRSFYERQYNLVMTTYINDYKAIAIKSDNRQVRARIAGIKLKINKNLDKAAQLFVIENRARP